MDRLVILEMLEQPILLS